eukprot:comp22280_c0_seq1/m.53161 comp22280_c0_seq1/g.53161  ORF comp22280_c0_seq1/g.53161 comp22280_c0_seq1/m.53161 type:complete len:483 (+) comp22280_c0_seq1:301-1749(+)
MDGLVVVLQMLPEAVFAHDFLDWCKAFPVRLPGREIRKRNTGLVQRMDGFGRRHGNLVLFGNLEHDRVHRIEGIVGQIDLAQILVLDQMRRNVEALARLEEERADQIAVALEHGIVADQIVEENKSLFAQHGLLCLGTRNIVAYNPVVVVDGIHEIVAMALHVLECVEHNLMPPLRRKSVLDRRHLGLVRRADLARGRRQIRIDRVPAPVRRCVLVQGVHCRQQLALEHVQLRRERKHQQIDNVLRVVAEKHEIKMLRHHFGRGRRVVGRIGLVGALEIGSDVALELLAHLLACDCGGGQLLRQRTHDQRGMLQSIDEHGHHVLLEVDLLDIVVVARRGEQGVQRDNRKGVMVQQSRELRVDAVLMARRAKDLLWSRGICGGRGLERIENIQAVAQVLVQRVKGHVREQVLRKLHVALELHEIHTDVHMVRQMPNLCKQCAFPENKTHRIGQRRVARQAARGIVACKIVQLNKGLDLAPDDL